MIGNYILVQIIISLFYKFLFHALKEHDNTLQG